MKGIAFILRLIILVACPLIGAFHPGVFLRFDRERIIFAFVLIPASVLIGYFISGFQRKSLRLTAVGAIVLLSLLTFGFEMLFFQNTLIVFLLGVATFFAFKRDFPSLLYLESLSILYMAARTGLFSFTSREMLESSYTALIVISVVYLLLFLAHAWITTRLSDSQARNTRPGLLTLALAGGLSVLLALLLVVFPIDIEDFTAELNNPDGRLLPFEQKGGDGEIWRSGDTILKKKPNPAAGSGSQHMVMVVESPVERLYMGLAWNDILDPVKGFVVNPELTVNSLSRSKYLETWENTEEITDVNRIPVLVRVYSALSERVFSWLPYFVEPVVMNNDQYPLRFSYRSMSLVSEYSLYDVLPDSGDIDEDERLSLAGTLEVNLSPSDLEVFTAYVREAVAGKETASEKIDALMKSFSEHQYSVSGEDDITVEDLKAFLFETKEGDCSEFSNTAALLARIAGIPSRVVTGFAVTRDLQTQAHAFAVREIQRKFAPLAEVDPNTLFLVTTAHAHSWPQFYLGEAGWVDVESTEYAIPPPPSFDPNALEIVIPEFRTGKNENLADYFPVVFVLRFVLLLAVLVSAAHVSRGLITLFLLMLIAKGKGEKALKARYRLVLFALNTQGYDRKKTYQTAREYGNQYPEIMPLMESYEKALLSPREQDRAVNQQRFTQLCKSTLAKKRSPASMLKFAIQLAVRGIK